MTPTSPTASASSHRLAWRPLVVAALALYLSACATGATAPAPATELQQDAAALTALKSAKVDLKFGAGALFQSFELVSASGVVQPPGSSDITIEAKAQDSLLELRLVLLPNEAYLRAPFIGVQHLTNQQASGLLNVNRIFDAKTGLPAILPAGQGAKVLGADTVDGHDCWKLEATYSADQVSPAVQPITPTGNIKATLWVGQDDHLMRKLILNGALFKAGQNTSVEVHLHDFNLPVKITPPAAG